jgi:nucleoside-diphosphate-sugar epimerase
VDWAGHPEGKAVTESSPLEPAPQQRGYYTQAKLEAERIVRAAAEERQLPAVILRPGQIWTDAAQLLTPAVGIRAGKLLVMIGDDSIRLPLIHVDDVVEGIVLATRSQFCHGEVFQFVDDDSMTRGELARIYMATREPELKDLHVSLRVGCALAKCVDLAFKPLGRAAPISPYRLRSAYVPLAFDCTNAREQLAWRPQVKSATRLRQLLKP